MLDKFLEYQMELKKKNEPYAQAIVVRREAPSSSRAGDKAIVNKFGEISGWIGGGCVKSIICKEEEDAMGTGKSRLVKIGNTVTLSKQEGIMGYQMTCQSEGTVEVFIEPVLPEAHLLVIGKTAIALALVRLSRVMGFRITAVAQDANLKTFEKVDELIPEINLAKVATSLSTFILIATQGENDEKALEEALSKDRAYIGFIASKKKMASIKKYLQDAGFKQTEIGSIKSPAGIDINAKTPDEVAISILAEIIQVRNTLQLKSSFKKFEVSEDKEANSPQYYINPVCGIPIDMNNPRHIIEHKEEKVYFCCDGCKEKFEKDPEKYIRNRAMGLAPEGM